MNISKVIEAYKQSFYIENIKKPLMVSIDITSQCNLNCAHCYNKDRIGTDYISSSKTAQAVVQKLKGLRVIEVTLCGGEPMLSPYFEEMVYGIKQAGMSVRLITNGLLLDRYIDFLCNVLTESDSIQISIDESIASSNHQRYPTKTVKERAYRNLFEISHRFNNVVVNITPTKLNQNEIKLIFEDVISHGARFVGATPYIPIGGTDADKIVPDYCFLGTIEIDLADLCRQKGVVYFGGISGHPCQQILPNLSEFNSNGYVHRISHPNDSKTALSSIRYCDAAYFSFHISNDGVIYPCAFMQDASYSISHIKYDLEKIYDDFIEYPKLSNIPLPDVCKKCSILSECHGGCVGLINDRYGDLQCVDPRCTFRYRHGLLEQK